MGIVSDVSARMLAREHLSHPAVHTHCAAGTSLVVDEEGPTLCLWNKLTKCPLPTLARHFVLCKYSSMSQSRVRKNCRGPGATLI